MKIFYSWQSDLENKHNRSFIKDALEKAIQELNIALDINDAERSLELDHDTKGVSGTPDLASTIFEKIASSTVFVAEREDGSRKLANPNVLIEMGYALSRLGSDRVLCVMNTDSGSVEDLPFDLKHKRHPVQYSSKNGSTDKEKQKLDLIAKLKFAIKAVVDLDKYKNHDATLPASPSREEIFNAVMSSDSNDDWETTGTVGVTNKETKYFKKNVHLRFELEY